MQQNIKKWWKFNVEKNIEVLENGGWHFNNLFSPEMISKKLKTFAHDEFSSDEYSNVDIIKEKIKNGEDLFNKGQTLKKIELELLAEDFSLGRDF